MASPTPLPEFCRFWVVWLAGAVEANRWPTRCGGADVRCDGVRDPVSYSPLLTMLRPVLLLLGGPFAQTQNRDNSGTIPRRHGAMNRIGIAAKRIDKDLGSD